MGRCTDSSAGTRLPTGRGIGHDGVSGRSLDLASGWQCVVISAVASALPWVVPAALAGHLTPLSGSFVRPRGMIGGW